MHKDLQKQKSSCFLKRSNGVNKIRFPETSGIGIKPISEEGTKRLVRAAIQYAINENALLLH